VQDPSDPAAILNSLTLGRLTTDALDKAVSLQTAEAFYAARDSQKAAYIYERLRRNLTTRTLQDEALADWLTLQMALCVQKTRDQHLMTELFTRALNSRSPAVRALAHYNLAFLQNHNRSFLESRQHAYQALALLKTIDTYIPQTIEADCYFLAAESLTRYLLRANNLGDDLPGSAWSASQPIHSLPITDQEQLGFLLTEGIDTLNQAVISPKVECDPQLSVGSQWSAYALDGPLDQLLWQYAAQAGINLSLSSLTTTARQHKSTLFLPRVDRNYLAEIAAGTAGLVWRYDGQTGQVYDPSTFQDSDAFRTTMAQEAIAIWQRFLLRYRGDNRTPNAHYCLGQLYTIADQIPTAMGEYKLLVTQFSNDPLAPYALLGSSKIKTNLRDYQGAQLDLNELLIRYPNAKVMDEAMLHLADATMNSGGYADAADMFQRLFYLNINQETRRQSAYGLGKCAYEQGRFEDAVKWLAQTLTLIGDSNDKRLTQASYMLGKAYIRTGQFVEAASALRKALDGKIDNVEYIRIILELADTEMKREQYLTALDILESIPEARLTQEDAVEVMLARARLYRQIDVPATAISLLRRKIEFIAESRLRAMMSLELAECYLQNKEPALARRELNDAVQYLPAGREAQRAAFLMARVAHLDGSTQQAESICLDVLKLNVQDETLRRQIYDLLGTIYTADKAYDRAALAYAGLLEQSSVQ
jgi:tetratricopeptide (TPR) repeat protein